MHEEAFRHQQPIAQRLVCGSSLFVRLSLLRSLRTRRTGLVFAVAQSHRLPARRHHAQSTLPCDSREGSCGPHPSSPITARRGLPRTETCDSCRRCARARTPQSRIRSRRCFRLLSLQLSRDFLNSAFTLQILLGELAELIGNGAGDAHGSDPYPTASQPKRSRIASTARSASQRAMPPSRARAARLVLEAKREAPAARPDAPPDSTPRSPAARWSSRRVICQHAPHQVLGDLGQDCRRRNRRGQRYASG